MHVPAGLPVAAGSSEWPRGTTADPHRSADPLTLIHGLIFSLSGFSQGPLLGGLPRLPGNLSHRSLGLGLGLEQDDRKMTVRNDRDPSPLISTPNI
ncbi:hypothetical protein SKAU_G00310560 [Synaphobranchus kaupii]|uniref:Uncharacterized protein n=1 Tax=Synaphobranchus kaupii TaxID=118154 RepID=A0A9Q1ERP2_SYNKA|nr:hypothetical protein SKAU_G00310560 [Synaphobranchus kaupii]